MKKTVLEFQDVSWKYEDANEYALDHIDLKVGEGEFVGIVGANDSGKSSLCRVCNGLIPQSFTGEISGRILVDGKDAKGFQTARLAKTVGSVFSDPEAQLSQITVFDELAFGPANLGVEKKEIIDRVDRILHLLGLEEMRDRSPFQLSGGEQQKVAIASVLSMNPEILVLDEPTSNLDPISTEQIFQVISKLNREAGITVLLVEHEIELLAQYAERIIVMDKGKIRLDGTPREVFSRKDVFDEIGIYIPQVTQVSEILKEQFSAWNGEPDPLTLEEMIRIIDRRREQV